MRNFLSLSKNILLSNIKRLSDPYKLTFALTYKCNLRCKICKIWSKPGAEELNMREIEKIFKNFNNLGWLDLTGGEITLRQDLIDSLRVIARNSRKLFILHISTNGQLPDKIYALAKEAIRLGLNPLVNVSIDGPECINDNLRGISGAYANSLETFKLLKSIKKGHYYLSCTISDYNVSHIDQLLLGLDRDLSGFSLADLHFNVFHNSAHYYDNQNVVGLSIKNSAQIKKYVSLSKTGGMLKKIIESRYLNGLDYYFKNGRPNLRCQALKSSCFINPFGEVYPCGMFGDALGNMRDTGYNFRKIWESPKAKEISGKIKDKICPGCWTPCEAYPAIFGSLLKVK